MPALRLISRIWSIKDFSGSRVRGSMMPFESGCGGNSFSARAIVSPCGMMTLLKARAFISAISLSDGMSSSLLEAAVNTPRASRIRAPLLTLRDRYISIEPRVPMCKISCVENLLLGPSFLM